MKPFSRYAISVTAGAMLAWMLVALIQYANFVRGGYTSESLVQPPLWTLGLVGGCGGLMGLLIASLAHRLILPNWVRPAAFGSLAGVAVVVVVTLCVAHALGGPSSKSQAVYLHAGRTYGLPIGLIAGAVAGFVLSRKSQVEPAIPSEHPVKGGNFP
jgi:hypothetical protein